MVNESSEAHAAVNKEINVVCIAQPKQKHSI